MKKIEDKKYTFEDIIEARDAERNRVRIILEYLHNKNSHPLPTGVEYQQFFNDIQDFEQTL